jgi:hypothetical protein
MMLRKQAAPKRNERCWCGSGKKYKYCCLPTPVVQPQRVVQYIDSGEEAVRYVICNARGTGFFSTKDNQVIVFPDRATAYAAATLDDFEEQAPGDINVAGVGPTKWEHLQQTLPFVEVPDIETAVALIHERIDYLTEKMNEAQTHAEANEPSSPGEPEQA